jgi:hypothetical protein
MKLLSNSYLSFLTLVVHSSIAQVHHSFALYDRSKIYVLTGVVTSINPSANQLQISAQTNQN